MCNSQEIIVIVIDCVCVYVYTHIITDESVILCYSVNLAEIP